MITVILMARKPLLGTVVKNLLEFETGVFNIEECRVLLQDGEMKAITIGRRTIKWGVGEGGDTYQKGTGWTGTIQGRWPANVMLEDCNKIKYKFPMTPSSVRKNKSNGKTLIWGSGASGGTTNAPDDSGLASRYFKQFQDRVAASGCSG